MTSMTNKFLSKDLSEFKQKFPGRSILTDNKNKPVFMLYIFWVLKTYKLFLKSKYQIYYRKVPKFSDARNIAVITLKFKQEGQTLGYFFEKMPVE